MHASSNKREKCKKAENSEKWEFRFSFDSPFAFGVYVHQNLRGFQFIWILVFDFCILWKWWLKDRVLIAKTTKIVFYLNHLFVYFIYLFIFSNACECAASEFAVYVHHGSVQIQFYLKMQMRGKPREIKININEIYINKHKWK